MKVEIGSIEKFEKEGIWWVRFDLPDWKSAIVRVPIAEASTEAEAVKRSWELLPRKLEEKRAAEEAARAGLPDGWTRTERGLVRKDGLEVVRAPMGVFVETPRWLGGPWHCRIACKGEDAELCVLAEAAYERRLKEAQMAADQEAAAIYKRAVKEWSEIEKDLRSDWGVEVLGWDGEGTCPSVLRPIVGRWVRLNDPMPVRWVSVGVGGSPQFNERLVPAGWKFRVSTRPGRTTSGKSRRRLIVEARNE